MEILPKPHNQQLGITLVLDMVLIRLEQLIGILVLVEAVVGMAVEPTMEIIPPQQQAYATLVVVLDL